MFPKKCILRHRRPHQAGHGMANIGRANSFPVKKFLSNGKIQSRCRTTRRMVSNRPFRHAQTCGATKYATGTARVQPPGDPQVEVRRIGQKRQVGLRVRRRPPAACGIRDGCAADAPPLPPIRLPPDWRHRRWSLPRPRADADPCSRRIGIRPEAAEFFDHQRGIEISRCLARRYQNVAPHPTSV